MALTFRNLDLLTRKHMINEIQSDIDADIVYISNYLNPKGKEHWAIKLLESAKNHDDSWLEDEISKNNMLEQYHTRKKPSGGTTQAKVPVNAPQTLAEGEFNRYYARGVCLAAIELNIDEVEVYRARHSENPRAQSQALLGRRYSPTTILDDIRLSSGVETALGVPPGPNSGLTIFY